MRALILTTLLTMALASAGCNTVKGLGQDLRKAGAAIEDAAKKK